MERLPFGVVLAHTMSYENDRKIEGGAARVIRLARSIAADAVGRVPRSHLLAATRQLLLHAECLAHDFLHPQVQYPSPLKMPWC